MSIVYPKDLFKRSYRRVHKASCFVLMPFDERFDEVYRTILDTLQSPDLNFVCRRADDIRAPNILETILGNIAQSEYVVADLTNSNPNVFYELGIAHCVKDAEKVIILAQGMEHVPFDLRHLRCVVYEHSASGLEILRAELLATFKEASRNTFRFRVRVGRRFTFGQKLAGRDNNLFELRFECPMIGYGVVKLLLHFAEYSIDQEVGALESQFLFLSEDRPTARVDHIPWDLHLVKSGGEGALLALERRS
jgi:hypothetical protein